MFVCWSVKGGSGTTVVSAALALVLARSRSTLLVDLAGDLPAALGMAEPSGPGVLDWLVSPTADTAALARLAVPATDTVQVLPQGTATPSTAPAPRWRALADALVAHDSAVVVDAGCGVPPVELHTAATHSLLVIRPCYLSLRRAVACGAQPTGIVVLTEPGRALGGSDVERAVRAPVVAEVPYDPTVARAVDAGLLSTRLPRTLTQPLRGAA